MLRSYFTLFALTFLTVSLAAQAQTPPPAVPSPATPPAPKLIYNKVHPDGPYIAITFDDGPHVTNTPRLLEMLAKRNIKATFFVVGECVHAHPEVLKQEVAAGHEIGNHSWSHPNLSKMSDAAVRNQLQQTQDAIVAATGVTPKLLRPPYGALSERQAKWINQEFGYKMILWEVDPLDWKRPGSAVVAQRILSQTHAGDIILAHDIHGQTVDAMPEVLDGLLAKGFKFVTVSQLLAMDHPQPKAPAGSPKGSPTKSPTSSPTPQAAPTP